MRWLAIVCALVFGGPALALSCVRPDVANTFQQAQESDDAYVVVHGEVTFDASLLPKRATDDPNAGHPDTLVPAQFVGRSLSQRGFVNAFERDITLYVQCFGPWCGSAQSGTEYLTFLKKTEAGYLMDINPCGGFNFAQPSQGQLDKVLACMQGQECSAAE